MEEVFREYVREINVGVRGGHLVFKMLNENQREYGTEDIFSSFGWDTCIRSR